MAIPNFYLQNFFKNKNKIKWSDFFGGFNHPYIWAKLSYGWLSLWLHHKIC
jgi:hypothetical protein